MSAFDHVPAIGQGIEVERVRIVDDEEDLRLHAQQGIAASPRDAGAESFSR